MKTVKIDVTRSVMEMERLLREYDNPVQSEEVIAMLRCWQDDEILDSASRERARMLVREFHPARLAHR